MTGTGGRGVIIGQEGVAGVRVNDMAAAGGKVKGYLMDRWKTAMGMES